MKECAKWAKVLEEQIIFADVNAFVVQITGEMDKNEKFAFICLFTSDATMNGLMVRVLAATAAANTGIDQPLLGFVLRVGVPRCRSLDATVESMA